MSQESRVTNEAVCSQTSFLGAWGGGLCDHAACAVAHAHHRSPPSHSSPPPPHHARGRHPRAWQRSIPRLTHMHSTRNLPPPPTPPRYSRPLLTPPYGRPPSGWAPFSTMTSSRHVPAHHHVSPPPSRHPATPPPPPPAHPSASFRRRHHRPCFDPPRRRPRHRGAGSHRQCLTSPATPPDSCMRHLRHSPQTPPPPSPPQLAPAPRPPTAVGY